MAKLKVIVSDLSGKQLEKENTAKVTISGYEDNYVLDAGLDELKDLIKSAKKLNKPGRKTA